MSSPTPLAQLNTPALQSNLNYIQSHNHELLPVLKNAAQSEAISVLPFGGYVRCKVTEPNEIWLFGKQDPVAERGEIMRRLQTIPPDCDCVFLFGSAGANTLVPLLQRVMDNPQFHVVVIEPTPARILLILALVECWPVLATERLHFVVSPTGDAFSELHPYNLWSFEKPFVLVAPEQDGRIAPNTWLQEWVSLCKEQQERRQAVSFGSHDSAGDTQRVKRVLFVNAWQGVAGGVHMNAIEDILKTRGVGVQTMHISRHRLEAALPGYRRQLETRFLKHLDEFSPDLVLSYGYHAPHCYREDLVDAIQIPWIQVVSNLAFFDEFQYPNEMTVVAEPNMIPLFKRRGYSRLSYLPLMADYTVAKPVCSSGAMPVVFVGNAMMLSAEEEARFEALWKGRESVLNTVREAIDDLAEFLPENHFYEWCSHERYPEINSEQEHHAIFKYILCKAGSARRVRVLEAVAPLGLSLFGGDWNACLPQHSPLRGCLKGYLPQQKEREVFQHGSIFLNMHSVGCVDSCNMRFFNTPAMGAFQIADNRRFSRFLEPDREVVFATSVDEYKEKVQYYLSHTAERVSIGRAGWERVSRDWTYANWLDSIADICNLKFG